MELLRVTPVNPAAKNSTVVLMKRTEKVMVLVLVAQQESRLSENLPY